MILILKDKQIEFKHDHRRTSFVKYDGAVVILPIEDTIYDYANDYDRMWSTLVYDQSNVKESSNYLSIFFKLLKYDNASSFFFLYNPKYNDHIYCRFGNFQMIQRKK